jgi:hypothetical protein
MLGLFSTLGWGLAALVFVSVLVALVEYLRQVDRPPQPETAPAPRVVSVDIDFAALPAAAPLGDQDERKATLDQTLARAAESRPEAAWTETSPMVLAGRRAEDALP